VPTINRWLNQRNLEENWLIKGGAGSSAKSWASENPNSNFVNTIHVYVWGILSF